MAGSWWTRRVRQGVRHVVGRLSATERREMEAWLSGPQLALFEQMHPADQRHGVDVVTRLRAEGHEDDDLLLAGLFHDCSKGHGVRLAHRVAWALGERYGEGVLTASARLPGFPNAFEALRDHAEASARLAEEAGCSGRTADLIRHQAAPRDPVSGNALRRADEAT
ncbi:hypothetical protein BH24CHL9_BH24CHL9_14200 [soil metagenome]